MIHIERKKNRFVLIFAAIFMSFQCDLFAQIDSGVKWKSEIPADCPIMQSKNFEGFELLRFKNYLDQKVNCDTWYPSWASDGNMYSPWTDGRIGDLRSNSEGEKAATGYATIVGDDPMNLVIKDEAIYHSSPLPYQSRYPCGSLVYNGVWYYGTYCLYGGQVTQHNGITYNWPWMGPFVGFRFSTDCGKTWTETPCTPEKPLFGETVKDAAPVKIGAPHFVDFGKNMESSPDGKAYLVAHGSSDGKNRRFGFDSWITGDEIYLVRVIPGIKNMNNASEYEYWNGKKWTRDFNQIKSIATWKDNMGCVTITYNKPLKRYFMCVTDGVTTGGFFNTYILESSKMTGNWKMAYYFKHFGEQGYFVNIPSKFISKDGITFWLSYSANFATTWDGMKIKSLPQGSCYSLCLQEMKLIQNKQHPRQYLQK